MADKARIIVYDDLMILDETETFFKDSDQLASIARQVLSQTPDAEIAEVWVKEKIKMRFTKNRKGKIVKSNTLHPGWGGRREGAGSKGKGEEALTNRVVFHVNDEMFEFLDALGKRKPEWIRLAVKEKREREENEKGSQ